MTDRIIVNYNPITGEMSIPQTGTVTTYVPASEINPAKTKQKPTHRVKYNHLHRPGSDFVTKPNTENEEPKKVVTIATIEEPTTTITKRKPKHTRMRPATDRRAVNQMLAQMRNSNIYPNGIIYTRNVDLSKSYNLTSYLRYVGDYSIDAYNLSATDTKQRFTTPWQKEIQKVANKLNAAKAKLKSAKKSPLGQDYIDILQEDYDALQQQFYQLIARHQQSFNNPKDYTKQIRADRRRAKQLMHGTPKEQLSLAKFYELYVEEPIDTPIIDACLEAEKPAIKEQVLQAWRDAQKQAQQQRFADCMRSLYYEK